MKRWLILLLVLPWTILAGREPVHAQEPPAPTVPLEAFVRDVARLWADADAAALVALAPRDGRIMIDVGSGTAGPVQGRHATAALRDLFGGRETVSIRAMRVTVAGGSPARGFGELAWESRSRGVTVPQSVTVYVGTIWDEGRWRVRELRVLR